MTERNNINVTDEVKEELVKRKGEMMAERGKEVTYDGVLRDVLDMDG